MHRTNHHTYKPAYVGRVRADGQFDILWRSRELVEPQAFSPYLRAAGGAN
jgi:urea transport system substrate-binding protein